MKTNKRILVVMALWPFLTNAQNAGRADVQTINSETAQRVLQEKLSTPKTHESGVQIRPVSKDLVNQALERLGGNATVELPGREMMKFVRPDSARRSGGVVVGNGGDGLVATSSADRSAPVVVQPPIVPNTSITVVGRAGANQSNQFCVLRYNLNQLGEIEPRYTKSIRCASFGSSIRVTEGTYYVSLRANTYMWGTNKNSSVPSFHSSVVSLSNGENKVLTLSEIHVPKQAIPIKFSLTLDLSSSDSRRKIFNYLQPAMTTAVQNFDQFEESCRPGRHVYSRSRGFEQIEVLRFDCGNLRLSIPNDLNFNYWHASRPIAFYEFDFKSGPWREHEELRIYHSENDVTFGNERFINGVDGEFVSVFPGSYAIVWDIEGNLEITRGIRVE